MLGGFTAWYLTPAGLSAALRALLGSRFLEERVRPVHMLVASLLPDRPVGAAGSVFVRLRSVCLHQLLVPDDMLDPHHSLVHVGVRIDGPHALPQAGSLPFCMEGYQLYFIQQRLAIDVCPCQPEKAPF